MATFVHKAMVYLGLADDDLDEYEGQPYDEAAKAAPARTRPAPAADSEPTGAIRALHRDEPTAVATMAPPPPQPTPSPRPAVVRPIATAVQPKVHVVVPGQFADAQEIGDRLKSNQPVIVNLQNADRDLSRRMIDFCSGVTYALGGSMDKVADQVFLLTPTNVEVSAEEKRRLQERGLYRA